jgi:hypothetical protein
VDEEPREILDASSDPIVLGLCCQSGCGHAIDEWEVSHFFQGILVKCGTRFGDEGEQADPFDSVLLQ